MVAVAVAGGLGDMGRLIVEELLKRRKYEVYVLSRRAPAQQTTRISPLSGKEYSPLIQADYTSEDHLVGTLSEYNINTVICAMALDFESAADAQVNLIRAADRAPSVKRFIPSEFNVDYDLGDDVLPYPEKKYHTVGRRELEKTSLEFTYIYNGMFMDYYAMPNVETNLRPLYNVVDASNGVAAIPGDGNTLVALSFTRDVARYTSFLLELEQWPAVATIVGSQITLRQLVSLVEKSLGQALEVAYDPIEKLKKHDATILPSNEPFLGQFPGGRDQVKALLADLGAAMALGAYDFSSLDNSLDVVKYFAGKTEPPLEVEELLKNAWAVR
ncbi:NAD(P)-binding domain protein [Pleurostoma richardsiae]|uniref:NAD(P)-binding domain protein n=1 Tax=Pleurostoma richardsiae TaxID=41990 RepID=A0AA38RSU5_9PEZI|nr:NAD(P)-binding domain protein [Pleurostoma richardsiae]